MTTTASAPVIKPEQQMVTVTDAAIALRLSQGTIRNMIHSGELQASRLGKVFRIPATEIDRLIGR